MKEGKVGAPPPTTTTASSDEVLTASGGVSGSRAPACTDFALVEPDLNSPTSPLDAFGPVALRQHVRSLRTEALKRLLRPLLTRLLNHNMNRGVFNVPVDPVKLGLPDYTRVITQPMDLGTIKGRLQSHKYLSTDDFVADIRLVLNNALRYNPPPHHVHTAARKMLEEFEETLHKVVARSARNQEKRTEHECSFCHGQSCPLCNEKCIKFDPPVLVCHGPCGQRIKRAAYYHITRDGSRLWCSRCYGALGPVLPSAVDIADEIASRRADGEFSSSSDGGASSSVPSTPAESFDGHSDEGETTDDAAEGATRTESVSASASVAVAAGSGAGVRSSTRLRNRGRDDHQETAQAPVHAQSDGGAGGASWSVERVGYKTDLLKRRFDEEVAEPWVQCDQCDRWLHQICAMFNPHGATHAEGRENADGARQFICPLCRISAMDARERQNAANLSGNGENRDSSPRRGPRRGKAALLAGAEGDVSAADQSQAQPPVQSQLPMKGEEGKRAPSSGLRHRVQRMVAEAEAAADSTASTCSTGSRRCSPRSRRGSQDASSSVASAAGRSDDARDVTQAAHTDTPPSTVAALARKCSPRGVEEAVNDDEGGLAGSWLDAAKSMKAGVTAVGMEVDVGQDDAASAAAAQATAAPVSSSPSSGALVEPCELPHCFSADALPRSRMGDFVESYVHRRLTEIGGEAASAADTVTIRVVSSLDCTLEVPDTIRSHFVGAGPPQQRYRSKAILMFQRIDGVDVALFTMYVQEFDASSEGPNARRAYVAYLDSVEYFRPKSARTVVYHEILIAYLDWCRQRGFIGANIWACPPQRGANFAFWCHPTHQRTPNKERLRLWYLEMLKRAQDTGAVVGVSTLHADCFAPYGGTLPTTVGKRKIGPARLTSAVPCPPIFDGDFWVEEALRLHRTLGRRKGPLDCRWEEKASWPFLDQCLALVSIVMQHTLATAFNQPVDPVALRIPDYYDVIESPMDFGTARCKLQTGGYLVVQELIDDMRLVFDNARQYNAESNRIYTAAVTLSNIFEREVKAMVSHWELNSIGNSFQTSLLPNSAADSGARSSDADPSTSATSTPTSETTDDEELDDDEVVLMEGDEKGADASNASGVAEAVSSPADMDVDDGCECATAVTPAVPPPWRPWRARLVEGKKASWLCNAVSNAVAKFNNDLLSIHLQHRCSQCDVYLVEGLAEEQWSVAGSGSMFCGDCYRKYKAGDASMLCAQTPRGDTSDPDVGTHSVHFVDHRQMFLELCQFRHYQFDSLRRAKHSSAMLLHHLHDPSAPSLNRFCNVCSVSIDSVRWHCSQCSDFDLCAYCNANGRGHEHLLTPYRINMFNKNAMAL